MRSGLNPMAPAWKLRPPVCAMPAPSAPTATAAITIPTGPSTASDQPPHGDQRRLNRRRLPARRPLPARETRQKAPRHVSTSPAAQHAQRHHAGQSSRRGRQFAAVQDVAFLARLFAAVLRCLFGALSGHRLASQPQPAGAAISRSAISSSPAKRASIKRGHSASEPVRIANPVSVLRGTVSDITGSCGLSLPSKRHRNLDQHGGRQHRRGQFHAGQKDSARRAHDGQPRSPAPAHSCPAAPRESCAPAMPAGCGPGPRRSPPACPSAERGRPAAASESVEAGSIRLTSEKLNCTPAICPANSSISFSSASVSP